MALDMTAVTGALTALKSLTGIAKDVNNIEFNQKIIKLQQKLLDIQTNFSALLDENRSLRSEIEAGKAYELHHSVLWKKLPDGSDLGPYCPICRGDQGKEMPLHYRGPLNTDAAILLFSCPIQHVAKGRDGTSCITSPKHSCRRNGLRDLPCSVEGAGAYGIGERLGMREYLAGSLQTGMRKTARFGRFYASSFFPLPRPPASCHRNAVIIAR